MHSRPSKRDWLAAVLLGVGTGAVVLGIGGRAAMRGIALLAGTTPGFSLGGTTTVVLLGALSGLAAALVLAGLRWLLPTRPVLRGAAFWLFLVLVTLRGLRPLDTQRLLLFMPLVLAYGITLQALWCRVRKRRHAADPPLLDAPVRPVFALLIVGAALPPTPASERRGPDLVCATDAQRALGVFVGDFDVHATYRAGPAAWDSSSARSPVSWDLDGCILVERYLSIWGAAGDSVRPIQQVFVHSQHGVLGLSEGGWNAAGDTLVLEDSAWVRGRWIHQRHITSRPAGGSFVSEGRRSEDGGRTWFPTHRSRYVARR